MGKVLYLEYWLILVADLQDGDEQSHYHWHHHGVGDTDHRRGGEQVPVSKGQSASRHAATLYESHTREVSADVLFGQHRKGPSGAQRRDGRQ